MIPPSAQAGAPPDVLPKAAAVPANSGHGADVALAPETQIASAAGPVQIAQMVNRVGQSEMRIEMNTSAFGNVEVRTVVHANDVGLVIGSEKGDLRTLLANEIPVITNTLQQQNLRLNSVNYMQGFAFSHNASGGGDSQPRSFVPNAPNNYAPSPGAAEAPAESAPLAYLAGANGNLSILA
jgi:flagellar hook-length control protein FliK